MHEVGDVNIPAILFAIVVVCVFYHLIWRQVKASEARNIEVLKLQQLAAEEVALIERQAAEDFRLASEFQLSQQTTTSRRRGNFGGEDPRSSSLVELSGSTKPRPNHDSYSARITSESSSSWITSESSSAWVTGDHRESSLDPIITGGSSSGRITSLVQFSTTKHLSREVVEYRQVEVFALYALPPPRNNAQDVKLLNTGKFRLEPMFP
mgnify:CR=1 FL=1